MNYDYKEFEKFAKNFQKIVNSAEMMVDSFLITTANECKEDIERDTPVDMGNLKENWVLDNHQRNGEVHSIDIYNPLEYASYMEDGYNTTKLGQGKRFVPGKWVGGKFRYQKGAKEGMIVKERFIEGRHMGRININKTQYRIQGKFNKTMKNFLKKHGVGE